MASKLHSSTVTPSSKQQSESTLAISKGGRQVHAGRSKTWSIHTVNQLTSTATTPLSTIAVILQLAGSRQLPHSRITSSAKISGALTCCTWRGRRMQLAIQHGRHDLATPRTALQEMIMAVPLLLSSSVAPPQHKPCCVPPTQLAVLTHLSLISACGSPSASWQGCLLPQGLEHAPAQQ